MMAAKGTLTLLSILMLSQGRSLNDYEYLYAGGMNKYKAAFQFLNEAHLNKYEGFHFPRR